MPELPDILLYVDLLRPRLVGALLERLRVFSPFLLRTFEPSAEVLEGRTVTGISRLGKRVVLEFEDDLFAVIHLMIAGRFRWEDGVKVREVKTTQSGAPMRPAQARACEVGFQGSRDAGPDRGESEEACGAAHHQGA
jgi:formamidopyrimidine-DNA glycosylase